MPDQSKDKIYNRDRKEVDDVLSVWQTIELLTPSMSEKFWEYLKAAANLKESKKEFRNITDRKVKSFLLEEEPFKNEINKEIIVDDNQDATMYWHAYVGYINWSEAETKIKQIIQIQESGNKEKKDNFTIVPIIGLCLNRDGRLIDTSKSIIISSAAYVFGQILKLGNKCNIEDIISFENNIEDIVKDIKCEIFMNNIKESHMLTVQMIHNIANKVARRLHIEEYLVKHKISNFPELCIRKVIVTKKHNQDDKKDENTTKIIVKAQANSEYHPKLEIFDSFFLDQIMRVKKKIGNIKSGSAIGRYLGMSAEPETIDVLQDHNSLKTLFSKEQRPLSRWPSDSAHVLALLQEGALNAIMTNFKNDDEQLFAINGPPGTGKTTLMSDLIVNIYVQRAIELAKLSKPENGLTKNNDPFCDSYSTKFMHNAKELIDELKGFEIVVASSNNNAVENITKEIKLQKNIHTSYIEEFKLFNWLEQKESIWGIFAAILGNYNNKIKFRKEILGELKKDSQKQHPPNLLKYLDLLKSNNYDLTKIKKINPEFDDRHIDIKWNEVKDNFNNLNAEIKNTYASIDSYIKISHKELAIEVKYPDGLEIAENKIQVVKNKIFNQLKNKLIDLKNLKQMLINISFEDYLSWHKYFNTKKYKIFIEKQDSIKAEVERINQEIIKVINNTDMIDYDTNYDSPIIDIDKKILTQNISLWQQLFNTSKYQQYNYHKDKLFRAIEFTNEKITSLQDYDLTIANNNLKEINSAKELVKAIKLKKDDLISQGFNVERIKGDKYWLNNDLDHKYKPYYSQKFEQKRTELFSYAVKLHELFIEGNATHFWCIIKAFFQIDKQNTKITRKSILAAWQSLFMIVPVVSTTFHSFKRTFEGLKQKNLGWLIIDEAGQAPPQYAVYAMYLCKNVIVVGDPMQTKPISSLGEEMIDSFFTSKKQSSQNWSPHVVSAQILADRNSLYQTQYRNSKVGFPLLVHRRCIEPMFSIINKIIYDNKMILATKAITSVISQSWGKSRWLEVIGGSDNGSKFSEDEYQLLIKMLKKLFVQDNSDSNLIKEIYIITMFVDYKEQLKDRLAKENWLKNIITSSQLKFEKFIKAHIGTIHAFQGKENDTVIMMLGAQSELHKHARSNMTRDTNVINVGISRAKNNLYIIGNRSKWSRNGFMQEVISELDIYEKSHNTN